MLSESEVSWNPLLETLPREEIVKLQVKKFKRIMKRACEHSKFHGQLYRDAGLEPGDINTHVQGMSIDSSRRR